MTDEETKRIAEIGQQMFVLMNDVVDRARQLCLGFERGCDAEVCIELYGPLKASLEKLDDEIVKHVLRSFVSPPSASTVDAASALLASLMRAKSAREPKADR